MTKEQIEVINQLRHEGYAIIIWTPEECKEANPRKVEDESISYGWEIIKALQ